MRLGLIESIHTIPVGATKEKEKEAPEDERKEKQKQKLIIPFAQTGLQVNPVGEYIQRPPQNILENANLNYIRFQTKFYSFVPLDAWRKPSYTWFEITVHFIGKSCRKVRFEHKLWNALQLTLKHPEMYPLIGVIWISDRVIQVNRLKFGKLLDLAKSTSALFSQHGSFPTHGFIELTFRDVQKMPGVVLAPDRDNELRFFMRPDGKFTKGSTPDEIEECRYVAPV